MTGSFSCSWLNETRTSLQWFIKIKFYLLESKKTRQQCCHNAFILSLKWSLKRASKVHGGLQSRWRPPKPTKTSSKEDGVDFTASVRSGQPWFQAWPATACPCWTGCQPTPHSWQEKHENFFASKGKLTFGRSPPPCLRCSVWCSLCRDCQTSFKEISLETDFLHMCVLHDGVYFLKTKSMNISFRQLVID